MKRQHMRSPMSGASLHLLSSACILREEALRKMGYHCIWGMPDVGGGEGWARRYWLEVR